MSTQSPLTFPQPLTERYRPQEIGQFLGHSRAKAALANFARRPFPSAWLFLGPSGTGKTSMALALAAALPAELHHIPSRSCDLETVESTCRACHYVPGGMGDTFGAQFHLVLVDEADQMTGAAQLAFLSKLDATAFPPSTIFVFTANSTARLEDRFLSRLNRLEFDAESAAADLPAYLADIWSREVVSGVERPDFAAIAEQSAGNVRDALSKLEVELLSREAAPPSRRPTPRRIVRARAASRIAEAPKQAQPGYLYTHKGRAWA